MGKDLKGKEIGKGLDQIKNGRYRARISDRFGKRIEKKFDYLAEAKRWIAEVSYLSDHGNISASSDMLLDTWFEYWLDTIKGNSIRQGSRTVYLNRYKSRIHDVIGHMTLSNIKPMHCQAVLRLSNEAGEPFDSNKKLRSIMYSLFQSAVENDLIEKNPIISSVKALGEKSPEKVILTAEQQKRFLEEAKKVIHYPVFAFVLETGVRGGELSGLKWSDIDWKNRTITVKREVEFFNGRFMEFPPKSAAGFRTIPLTKRAYDILVAQKDKKIPVIVGYHEYVFRNSKGKPQHRHIYNRSVNAIGEKIGVSGLSMHSLRHSFATRCIESGMKPKTLQRIMGHSSLSITMDLYVHVTDDELHKEIEKLDKYFSTDVKLG